MRVPNSPRLYPLYDILEYARHEEHLRGYVWHISEDLDSGFLSSGMSAYVKRSTMRVNMYESTR